MAKPADALAIVFSIAALHCFPALSQTAASPAPEETSWRTVAEASEFRATSSYAETLDFLRRLEERLPEMRLDFYGLSGEGRPLPVVVVSKERAFSSVEARRLDKPIVMIQNGIHAGEIDGKDASLMILRDLALGKGRDLLDAATLVILPIYNVDGHERVSPFNRPNQNGPVEGMGFRTTSHGLDLNRDHLKLETREARAMIGLFNRWRPDLHVDNHVTDGSAHAWVLTWSWAEGPQAAPSIDAWLGAHMPVVLAATEAAGHPQGPYVALNDRSDPSKGFSTRVGEPRYATGYYPLRNRPSILVEMHSYKPYRDRVLANRDFLLALIREVGKDAKGLMEAVRDAEARTVALGAPGAEPSPAALIWGDAPEADTIRFPVFEWFAEPSMAMGGVLLDYREGKVKEIEVPWIHKPAPVLTVPRPRGYLVKPGWPQIEERLAGHGLRVEALIAPARVEAEAMRLSDTEVAASPYQGRHALKARVDRRVETVEFPPGTLWIPAAQPDFEVAVQLLEPEAPDSLVSWGFLSAVVERKEYIDPRGLEKLAREMLEDPQLAAAWDKALENEEFAADRQARYEWWYRRTPYWDESVGLMPVYRLIKPADLPTEPWTRPGE